VKQVAHYLRANKGATILNSGLAAALHWTTAIAGATTRRMGADGLIRWGDSGWVEWSTDEEPQGDPQPETPRSSATTPATPPIAEESSLALDSVSANWPQPIGKDAYYGFTGEFVQLVSPESEADPNALLLSFLVGIGAMVGRNAHFLTEATNQCVNEFTVIVGDTAKARKTTATDRALFVFRRVDADFMDSQICRGLATGEGLIYRIRDPHIEGTTLDRGVKDKRLLCIETEFSSILRSIRMNKLSEDLRKGFDGNPIERNLRKHSYGCKNPHIAIIGNTTIDELRGLLNKTDKANGFGNRFLWCCARRF